MFLLCQSPLIFIVSHHFSDSKIFDHRKTVGFLTTNSQDGQGGHVELTAPVAMVELTEDRRISKVFRTCYAVDGPWGYTCLGKLTGLFHCGIWV